LRNELAVLLVALFTRLTPLANDSPTIDTPPTNDAPATKDPAPKDAPTNDFPNKVIPPLSSVVTVSVFSGVLGSS
jgi:hypothetical protein